MSESKSEICEQLKERVVHYWLLPAGGRKVQDAAVCEPRGRVNRGSESFRSLFAAERGLARGVWHLGLHLADLLSHRLAVFLPTILVLATVVLGGDRIDPLLSLEIAAVVTTIVVGIQFFLGVFSIFCQGRTSSTKQARAQTLGLICLVLVAVASLLLGLVFLFAYHLEYHGLSLGIPKDSLYLEIPKERMYGAYLACVCFAFLVFVMMDLQLARVATRLREARAYWALGWFGDLPTFVGAATVGVYYLLQMVSSGSGEVGFMGGALAVQMFFADYVVYSVGLNRPFYAFQNLGKSIRSYD